MEDVLKYFAFQNNKKLYYTYISNLYIIINKIYSSAHPTKKKIVKRLLAEGRLEITTGGWVMTDEATSHIYGMLDQLIEGNNITK